MKIVATKTGTIVKIWMIPPRWRSILRILHASSIDETCIWLGTAYLVRVAPTKYWMTFGDVITCFVLLLLTNKASFGGIFGLCLGGSVISLVEVIYFFTLRLYSVIINRPANFSSKQNDSKRVSISNNVKTVEINPKSFLQNLKVYQQFERHPKWHRMRPSIFGSSTGSTGTILGKTAIHEFNKPAVHEFLK